ncbi:MAG: hypothetical protein ACRD1U_16925 [Vicinamibacterales bacterium]
MGQRAVGWVGSLYPAQQRMLSRRRTIGDGSFDKSLAEEMQPGPDLQAEQSAASGMDTEHAGLDARRQSPVSGIHYWLPVKKLETGNWQLETDTYFNRI